MSVFFNADDLLCYEDSDTSTTYSGVNQSECSSSDLEIQSDAEESIASFIQDERNYVPGIDYIERFHSQSLEASARKESVAWIVEVQRFYRFQPLTAYLSVNYLDRFLDSRPLPQTSGWPLHLLAVACLSLAAKMEEPLVPSLRDLQVQGAKYMFESKTIQRMELLVLNVLKWRLRSVTPFSFLTFFAYKLDSTGNFSDYLVSTATEIILSNIQEARFLEFRPSCIAAATLLCAAKEIPNLSFINAEKAESWCDGLIKEKIISCYQLTQHFSDDKKGRSGSDGSSFSFSSSSSSSSSSSPLSSSNKRRKINNCLWVNDYGRSK